MGACSMLVSIRAKCTAASELRASSAGCVIAAVLVRLGCGLAEPVAAGADQDEQPTSNRPKAASVGQLLSVQRRPADCSPRSRRVVEAFGQERRGRRSARRRASRRRCSREQSSTPGLDLGFGLGRGAAHGLVDDPADQAADEDRQRV